MPVTAKASAAKAKCCALIACVLPKSHASLERTAFRGNRPRSGAETLCLAKGSVAVGRKVGPAGARGSAYRCPCSVRERPPTWANSSNGGGVPTPYLRRPETAGVGWSGGPRCAHNPKVAGSNPAPATTLIQEKSVGCSNGRNCGPSRSAAFLCSLSVSEAQRSSGSRSRIDARRAPTL
jgi:hypothetical protein